MDRRDGEGFNRGGIVDLGEDGLVEEGEGDGDGGEVDEDVESLVEELAVEDSSI